MGIMKQEILSFKIEQPKHRAHRVLFQNNTPFKPKVVESKTSYKRQPKHKNRSSEI